MQPGRDVNSAAIALFTARLHHPSQTSHQAVLNALIFQLDVAMERFAIFVFSSFSCAPLAIVRGTDHDRQCCDIGWLIMLVNCGAL